MTNEIKYFSRNANELPVIFHFLNAVMTENASNLKLLNELKLSVEEIFMNMVRHNKTTNKDIAIRIESYKNSVSITLTDHEDNPFDILDTDEIDFDEYFKQKKFGGLGIHLIKKLMDDLIFDHDAGKTTIKITKHIN
tara:strand:+ start:4029 stop:4439 length:411 start_codon:yes stop_codon:yes gene_type:complete